MAGFFVAHHCSSSLAGRFDQHRSNASAFTVYHLLPRGAPRDMDTKVATRELSTKQVELISRTIAKGADKDELALFIGQCKRTELDPFARQIYFIKDKSGRVMTQISVDGFRLIANRSGDYAGQDEPVFEESDNGKIVKCSVAVYRWRGENRYKAAVGVAYWSEYARTSPTWDKMPRTMLSKVAECIALRKAFPNDLSGLYAEDEVEIEAAVPVSNKRAEAEELMKRGEKKPEIDIESEPQDVDAAIKDEEVMASEETT